MTRLRRLAICAVAGLLAACAAVPRGFEAPSSAALSGRLTVRVEAAPGSDARSVSAAFELRGDPAAGALDLSTPLGTVMVQARWAPGSVVLVTPEGEKRFADLAGLTREVLGESLPIEAMFDWLRGHPWSGAPSAAAAGPGFRQLGWTVSLARFDEAWIVATRESAPVVTVRAKLDR